jgi:hypothetical protein
MPVKEIVTNKAIVGGSMLASSSLLTSITILNDIAYLYLAIIGSVVSMFGVLHELSKDDTRHTKLQIISEVIKGLILGIFAIPFWYLLLNAIGDTLVYKVLGLDRGGAEFDKSIWLILSFYLSWWSVPIVDTIYKLVQSKFKGGKDE